MPGWCRRMNASSARFRAWRAAFNAAPARSEIAQHTDHWWPPPSASPEILEPRGRQFSVAHRVLNVLMAQVCLQGACIMRDLRQCVAARVAQHVRVNYEVEAGAFADPLNKPINGTGRERTAALGLEHKGTSRVALE